MLKGLVKADEQVGAILLSVRVYPKSISIIKTIS